MKWLRRLLRQKDHKANVVHRKFSMMRCKTCFVVYALEPKSDNFGVALVNNCIGCDSPHRNFERIAKFERFEPEDDQSAHESIFYV